MVDETGKEVEQDKYGTRMRERCRGERGSRRKAVDGGEKQTGGDCI